MAAVWARARSELRRHRRATVLLTVLVGLAGGVVLAAVAGSRRTDSAMDRFLAYHRPLDVAVVAEGLDLHAVERLPQVAGSGVGAYMALTPSSPSGAPDPGSLGTVNPWVSVSSRGSTSDLPLLVAGRLPDPAQPLEAAVDETLAARRGIRPGGTLRMWAYTPRQVERELADSGKAPAPAGPAFDLIVTGVVRVPQDISPVVLDQDVIYLGTDDLYLTPAFWRGYGTTVGKLGSGEAFRLRRGQRVHDRRAPAARRPRGGRPRRF